MDPVSYVDIQSALKQLGFHPGPVDGVPGRRTVRAIRSFQRIMGHRVDGVLGPETASALLGGRVPRGVVGLDKPWFAEAWRLRGVTETPGSATNPVIAAWAADLGSSGFADSTPWCGLFVSHCIAAQLPEEPLPREPMRALGWAQFGRACRPQPGAIAVFWRQSPTSGQGHVGFYCAEDEDAIHLLGGNQGDCVSVTRMPRNRLVAMRWPRSANDPVGKPLAAAALGLPSALRPEHG